MTLLRLLSILLVVAKHRLDRLVPQKSRSIIMRVALSPIKLFPMPNQTPAESARLAIEELGPIFVKFGQLLSTRKDLLEPEIWQELQKLQDQVPPFDGGLAKQILESSLGYPISDAFSHFDLNPLASASVAQVHAATLKQIDKDGKAVEADVVVKIIRPSVHQAIKRDLTMMHSAARLITRFWSDAHRLHPIQIVTNYEETILAELDLCRESANTIRLRRNWHNSGKLYVPKIYDEYSTSNTMVMERIYGVTATDIASLTKSKVDLRALSHLGVEIFFTQVFEDNFFHADMHPGNVFIDTTNPDLPTYIALDCAIIGSLTENDKNYLAKNLLAFFHQDYDEVARLHIASGWVPADTNLDEFSRVIRAVCDPIFQKPIKDISFGTVLLSLFQTARQFDMEVQPQLVLLQKTLINIEGMGRQIYPDLDLWETAAPFMERWMKEQMGISSVVKRIIANAPRWLQHLPDIPDLAYNTMTEIKGLQAQNKVHLAMLQDVRSTLQAQAKRARYQRLGGLALIGAVAAMLLPLPLQAAAFDPLIPSSVLGTLGIYWMYIHS